MLSKGVDYWNKNRPPERQKGNGTSANKHIDFSNQDFRNKDFEDINLKGSVFDGSDLSGGIFTKSLTDEYTSFKGAILDNSDFRDTQLMGANLVTSTPPWLSK